MASNIQSPPPPPPSSHQSTDGNVENQFFYEDEVFWINKKGYVKFGLVMENFEAASSDNEDDFDDILSKGEIRVAWHPDGKEEIIDESCVSFFLSSFSFSYFLFTLLFCDPSLSD